ncbi:glycoside hydrolase family 76 protein [Deinococcus roseus]|uniref:CBM6 domain-containing protein n=1 Tax=Deinococcus roseus TaxID=392414 RepID=A0ABQ2D405_9DEIO|nr:glycoside hydrolase family 76 protein [Deinococcus roseus]GGJ43326.1 hypothetical protein GCM10008938_32010 [Deinococcus roseus]
MKHRLGFSVLLLTSLLSACAQTSTPGPESLPQGVAEDRDLASTNALLSYFDPLTGVWIAPSGESWQPAVGLDSIINTYERTRDLKFLNVIEKSFWRYQGRRSDYYDDNGWYLNTWLRAYDVTGDPKYLQEAKNLFDVNKAGWDSVCGGGIYWTNARQNKNAITNELFLLSAAKLHRRAGNGTGAGSYYDWAMKTWNWFKNSGMINSQNRINDGLNASCQNDQGLTWTYNQGVILGALVELYRFAGDRQYLSAAEKIATGTIQNQVYPGNILKEAACETSSCPGADHLIFKGMFAQGLVRLVQADPKNPPQQGFLTFLNTNANSVWTTSRDSNNGLGFIWKGPVGTVNQATQSAASLLLSGIALLNNGGEATTPPATTGTLYEAEKATLHNIPTESSSAGYTGTGYVAGWNHDGQWLDFHVNAPAAKRYTLTFRYATGAGDAVRYLYVNGQGRANNLLFTGTRGWDRWSTVSFSVPLNAGDNTISLIFDGSKASDNYLNLDSLQVK